MIASLDRRGGLLIADVQDQRIRRLDLATGVITHLRGQRRQGARPVTAARPPRPASLGARAVCQDGSGNTYICEREGNGVRKIGVDGILSTFAGTGERGYGGDGGPALAASWGRAKGPCVATCGATSWWWTRKTTPFAALTPSRASSSPWLVGNMAVTATVARLRKQDWTGRTAAVSIHKAIFTSPTATTIGCGLCGFSW